MKEPYYHLEYSSGNCLFRLYLNDLLIVDNLQGQLSLAGNILLNPFIFNSGTQELRIELLPKENEKTLSESAYVEFYLYKSDQSTKFDTMVDVLPRNTKVICPVAEVSVPVYTITLPFVVDVNYILPDYRTKGIDLNDIDNLESKVKDFYINIYQLALEKNAFELYELMKNSFLRSNTTMYENDLAKSSNIKIFEKVIKQLPVGNNIYRLQDLDLANIRIYGSNRVIDIRRHDGNTVLFYKKDEKDLSGISLDIRLYYNKETHQLEIL